jgi:hypothetical protein
MHSQGERQTAVDLFNRALAAQVSDAEDREHLEEDIARLP